MAPGESMSTKMNIIGGLGPGPGGGFDAAITISFGDDEIRPNPANCTSPVDHDNLAVCVSSARTDLCGGCQATGIPTATLRVLEQNTCHPACPELVEGTAVEGSI
jgi:hypothetical protein